MYFAASIMMFNFIEHLRELKQPVCIKNIFIVHLVKTFISKDQRLCLIVKIYAKSN